LCECWIASDYFRELIPNGLSVHKPVPLQERSKLRNREIAHIQVKRRGRYFFRRHAEREHETNNRTRGTSTDFLDVGDAITEFFQYSNLTEHTHARRADDEVPHTPLT
jgi:hypothetical protein